MTGGILRGRPGLGGDRLLVHAESSTRRLILLRHADSDSVAMAAKGKINFPDPNRVVELVFHFKGVRFPKPGTYWLNFLVDDMAIMVRPLFIAQAKPENEPQKPPDGNL